MLTANLIAQDRFFARTYTSNVLPKGRIDLELWHTSRFGHKGQFFHAQDQRMEFEMGLGKGLQTAFYFNRFQKRFSEGTDGTTTSSEIGFSNEWKWKFSDPSTNKHGLALYGEWGIKDGDEVELETKVILDKYVGKSLFTFNAIVEFEKEFEWEGATVIHDELESPVEFDFAYLYNLKPNLGIGFEIRNRNDIAKGKGWENSILYAGPTINYRTPNWFVIVNYQPQLTNLHKTTYAPYTKVLDEHERTEARIILGISIR
ncbi:MAG: hypothetical protein HYX40_11105 [Sphingobacteriales bacterium]|nr:hypothetical protein [Sphingobacteriales bacterium]